MDLCVCVYLCIVLPVAMLFWLIVIGWVVSQPEEFLAKMLFIAVYGMYLVLRIILMMAALVVVGVTIQAIVSITARKRQHDAETMIDKRT